jgi:hypothetical protein
MSTKTTFKRIALVAVAALGLSVVAVAPSTAAAPSYSVTSYSGTGVASATTATAIAGPANYVAVTNTDGTLSAYITVSGGTFTDASVAKTVAAGASVFVSTPTAGTITVKVTQIAANGVADATNAATLTITVLSAIVANIPTAANSTSFIASGAAVGVTADATVLSPRTVALQAGNITVSLKDANGAATTSSSLSATVSGPGVLGITSGDTTYNAAATGRAVTVTDVDTDGIFNVSVWGDGNAGVATITISTGTTVIATETVTFSGPAASFKVASTTSSGLGAGTVVKNLGITDTQTWQLSTLDAAGNLVSAAPSITVTVADSTIIHATASTLGAGTVVITGVKAGTSTFTVKDSATGLIVLGPVTVNVSAKTAVSATFALDKTDYAQGEAFTLTITAKEANGLPLADGTYASMATLASSSLVYSNTVAALGGVVSPVFSGGVATIKGFMPVNSATVAFSLTLGTAGVATAAQGAVLNATATVSNAEVQASQDAAAEATDAANAATDAANAAAEAADAATAAAQDAADAVAALSTEVAAMITALKKQITALTNLVIKIQKKVKA